MAEKATGNPRARLTTMWDKMTRPLKADLTKPVNGVYGIAAQPYIENNKTSAGWYDAYTGGIGVNPSTVDNQEYSNRVLPHELVHRIEYRTPAPNTEQESFDRRRRDTLHFMMNDMYGEYGANSIPPAYMTAGKGRQLRPEETTTAFMNPYFDKHPNLMKNFLGNLEYWQKTPPPKLPIYDMPMSSIAEEMQLAPNGDTSNPLNNNIYRNMMWSLANNLKQIDKHGMAPLRKVWTRRDSTTGGFPVTEYERTLPENYDIINQFNNSPEAERDKIFKFPKGR